MGWDLRSRAKSQHHNIIWTNTFPFPFHTHTGIRYSVFGISSTLYLRLWAMTETKGKQSMRVLYIIMYECMSLWDSGWYFTLISLSTSVWKVLILYLYLKIQDQQYTTKTYTHYGPKSNKFIGCKKEPEKKGILSSTGGLFHTENT